MYKPDPQELLKRYCSQVYKQFLGRTDPQETTLKLPAIPKLTHVTPRTDIFTKKVIDLKKTGDNTSQV
ncbi:MAG: hypothetical protein Q8R79_01510, partial [Legionellaceae bacterium]|nr:hypothetical protein [Legionellaceae bacterium]